MNYEDKHKFINLIKSDIKCQNTVIIDFLNIFTLFRTEKYKKYAFINCHYNYYYDIFIICFLLSLIYFNLLEILQFFILFSFHIFLAIITKYRYGFFNFKGIDFNIHLKREFNETDYKYLKEFSKLIMKIYGSDNNVIFVSRYIDGLNINKIMKYLSKEVTFVIVRPNEKYTGKFYYKEIDDYYCLYINSCIENSILISNDLYRNRDKIYKKYSNMDVILHVIKNTDKKIVNIHNKLNKVIENNEYKYIQNIKKLTIIK